MPILTPIQQQIISWVFLGGGIVAGLMAAFVNFRQKRDANLLQATTNWKEVAESWEAKHGVCAQEVTDYKAEIVVLTSALAAEKEKNNEKDARIAHLLQSIGKSKVDADDRRAGLK